MFPGVDKASLLIPDPEEDNYEDDDEVSETISQEFFFSSRNTILQ